MKPRINKAKPIEADVREQGLRILSRIIARLHSDNTKLETKDDSGHDEEA